MAQLKEFTQDTVALANSYKQAGDDSSAQRVLQMSADLGNQFGEKGNESLITRLVGIAVESIALRAMDSAAPYGGAGQTVQDRLNELTQERSNIKDINGQFSAVQSAMSTQDWISYINRWKLFGELAAEQWAVGKHGHS